MAKKVCERCTTREPYFEPCFGPYKLVCIECSKELENDKWYKFKCEIHYRFDLPIYYVVCVWAGIRQCWKQFKEVSDG